MLVSTIARSGVPKLPASDSRYLVIGADSDPTGLGNCNMVGKVAAANLYSGALTAAEVAALYAAY